MPSDSSPQHDSDRRAQWEAIGAQRRELIERDRLVREERERAEKQQVQQQQFAALQDIAATDARAAGREEWRQEQHAKRREEEAARRKAEGMKLVEEERKKKEEVAREEQRKKMQELHEHAVEKKIEQRVASAKQEEEHVKSRVTQHQEGQDRALQQELIHALGHLASDRRTEIQKVEQEAKRRTDTAIATVDAAKKAAASSRDAALEQALVDAKRLANRTRSDTDAWRETQLQEIGIRFERLEAEAKRDMQRKEALITADADRRRKEAEKRLEGTVGFLQKDA